MIFKPELLVLGMVLQIAVHQEVSNLLEGLEHFADNSNIPWNPPVIFIQARLQQCSRRPFLYSAYCSLKQYHSSQIGEALMWNDFMLHKLC